VGPLANPRDLPLVSDEFKFPIPGKAAAEGITFDGKAHASPCPLRFERTEDAKYSIADVSITLDKAAEPFSIVFVSLRLFHLHFHPPFRKTLRWSIPKKAARLAP
jgi:hypothetical protein